MKENQMKVSPFTGLQAEPLNRRQTEVKGVRNTRNEKNPGIFKQWLSVSDPLVSFSVSTCLWPRGSPSRVLVGYRSASEGAGLTHAACRDGRGVRSPHARTCHIR